MSFIKLWPFCSTTTHTFRSNAASHDSAVCCQAIHIGCKRVDMASLKNSIWPTSCDNFDINNCLRKTRKKCNDFDICKMPTPPIASLRYFSFLGRCSFHKIDAAEPFSLILALSSVSRFCDLLVNKHKLHFSSESKVIWRKQKEECAG
jgi:hypothetical protein